MIAIMLASLMMAVAIPDAFGDTRAAVRRRLPRDPDRPAHVPDLRRGRARDARARARRAHPRSGSSPRACSGSPARWPTARRARCCGSSRSRSTTAAPLALFWVPGRSRIGETAWEVRPRHFAERFGLFVIIALGESIVLTGATTLRSARRGDASSPSRPRSSPPPRCGGCTSPTSRGSPSGGSSWPSDRTRMARDAYTYLHVVIVAGDHRLGGRRRAGHRPPERAAAPAPRSRPSSPARRSTSSPTRCSACA